jgi:hypothetical protein
MAASAALVTGTAKRQGGLLAHPKGERIEAVKLALESDGDVNAHADCGDIPTIGWTPLMIAECVFIGSMAKPISESEATLRELLIEKSTDPHQDK